MTDDNDVDKSSTASADHVAEYLKNLAAKNIGSDPKYLPRDEQPFSDEELGHLVNVKRLKTLLNNSDDFLNHLKGQLDIPIHTQTNTQTNKSD